ncbi:GldG family protein [Synechococcus sp. W60.3]|uniref:GldG family protein n=3 Tax=unclassified Synechococcus TaxID=2626047 RepID=UPI0039C600E9
MKAWQALADWTGIVGLGVVAIGLLVGAALTGWTAVPLSLLAAGLALVVVWGLTHQREVGVFLGLRSTQTNANILVAVTAMAVILVLVNVVAARYDLRLDLTEEGLFTLSPQTRQLVQGLAQPMKVWVVTTAPDPNLREQLERYRRLNPERFQFEFVDPNRDPLTVQRLQVTQNNTLVVESGNNRQQLPQPPAPELESKLTPVLAKVVNRGEVVAYFVQGHGEVSLEAREGTPTLAQAVAALGQEGYRVEPLNLVQSQIPEEADVLVLAGPQRALFPGEVEKLQDYLAKGGRLLLLIGPRVDAGLDPLLEEWGVVLGDDFIIEVSSVSQLLGTGPAVALVTTYGDHPITAPLAEQRLMTLFPLARSVDTEVREGIQATPLLRTSPQSWGETSPNLEAGPLQFDPDQDKPGPLTLGVALTRQVKGDQKTSESQEGPTEARLVVIGNVNFALDGNLRQQGNRDLFLNTLNWLTERTEQISIRPKSITDRRLAVTGQNFRWLVLGSTVLLPLVALGSGAVLWWQRR